MNLYGLIGFPLSHSFSKSVFTEKFNREGLLDNQYELFPIESIAAVKQLLTTHPSLKGLNVTIPYKQSVLPFLDDLTAIPQGLDACNCIKIVDGKTIGYNTDVLGFEQSILPSLHSSHRKALVLGTGGAAAAVQYVFAKNNIESLLVSRQQGLGIAYAALTEAIINEYTIIVNTTPLGMHPKEADCPTLPYQFISSRHHLFDLIYNPAKTLFLQKGEAQGASIQNGLEMLSIQAEESWKIWSR